MKIRPEILQNKKQQYFALQKMQRPATYDICIYTELQEIKNARSQYQEQNDHYGTRINVKHFIH